MIVKGNQQTKADLFYMRSQCVSGFFISGALTVEIHLIPVCWKITSLLIHLATFVLNFHISKTNYWSRLGPSISYNGIFYTCPAVLKTNCTLSKFCCFTCLSAKKSLDSVLLASFLGLDLVSCARYYTCFGDFKLSAVESEKSEYNTLL